MLTTILHYVQIGIIQNLLFLIINFMNLLLNVKINEEVFCVYRQSSFSVAQDIEMTRKAKFTQHVFPPWVRASLSILLPPIPPTGSNCIQIFWQFPPSGFVRQSTNCRHPMRIASDLKVSFRKLRRVRDMMKQIAE